MFFHGNLYRGNRTTKINSGDFHAFDSPNLHPLATLKVKIDGKIILYMEVGLPYQKIVNSLFLLLLGWDHTNSVQSRHESGHSVKMKVDIGSEDGVYEIYQLTFNS